MSEKAEEPFPESRGLWSLLEEPLDNPGDIFEDTLMTVFMAALLLEKSQTSITESSSWPVLVKEAAERSSPLNGADLGRSKTGNLRRFFLIADKGLGPEKKFTYKPRLVSGFTKVSG